MTERCKAYANGFVCQNDAGHGEIHYDGSGVFWILHPSTANELTGQEPYSGARILFDKLHPVDKTAKLTSNSAYGKSAKSSACIRQIIEGFPSEAFTDEDDEYFTAKVSDVVDAISRLIHSLGVSQRN